MPRPKTRHVGTAGLVLRYRDGTCAFICRRCHAGIGPMRWREALRTARAHTCTASPARYGLTPAGLDAIAATRSAGGGR
jgi:hypothetical protein